VKGCLNEVIMVLNFSIIFDVIIYIMIIFSVTYILFTTSLKLLFSFNVSYFRLLIA